MKTMYFPLIGRKDPIADKDEVIWLFNQLAKQKNTPAQITGYWLDVKQTYRPVFLQMQAYELVEFVDSKVTTAQEKRRAAHYKKMQEKARKEMEAFKKANDKYAMMQELRKMITPN